MAIVAVNNIFEKEIRMKTGIYILISLGLVAIWMFSISIFNNIYVVSIVTIVLLIIQFLTLEYYSGQNAR